MQRRGLVPVAVTVAMALAMTALPSTAALAADPEAASGGSFWSTLDREQNVDGFVTRHVANECLTAAVAAVALSAVASSGAVAPMVGMALGAATEMSTIAVAATGCAAGAAAGVASAAMNWAWDEREAIGEATTTQVAYLYDSVVYAGETAGAVVAQAVGQPIVATAQLATAVQTAAGAAVASVAFGIGDWWRGGPAPDLVYDIASVPEVEWDERLGFAVQ